MYAKIHWPKNWSSFKRQSRFNYSQRGRSQTMFSNCVFFCPPTSLCLHFLPYKSLHFLTTYPFNLVNVVWKRPQITFQKLYRQDVQNYGFECSFSAKFQFLLFQLETRILKKIVSFYFDSLQSMELNFHSLQFEIFSIDKRLLCT